jgi:hypothetical protein
MVRRGWCVRAVRAMSLITSCGVSVWCWACVYVCIGDSQIVSESQTCVADVEVGEVG